MEIVTSHENTDFDGLASMLGVAKLYPTVTPVLPQRLNRNLRDFLALYWDELPFVRREDMPRGRLEVLILVDTQTIPSLKGLSDNTEVRFIDHHPVERQLEPRMSFHTGDVGSTTTLLVDQIWQARKSVSPVEATLLLLGIYEDTGSLSYPGTKPLDMRCGAWLLEQGASLEVANEFLHRPLTNGQRALYQKLVESAEFHEFAGQTIVIATASALGYLEEISVLAHKLRDLYEPAALFLLVELESGTQMVARSTSDAVDVAGVARYFEGGGHSKAAAALVRDRPLSEVREQLLQVLDQEVQPSVRVMDLMSHGVYTLSPHTSVSEAAQVMQRYGHEGFPVVGENGLVLGMLTRREIDKALQYDRGDAPISNYMHRGEIVVAPGDPVERLQEVMMQHDVGQVAVVDGGEIVGIVTRTDLIKLWAQPLHQPPVGDLASKVRQALPEPVLDLVLKASELAKERAYSLYLVGGFVRDLLLGKPHLDLDIVVEGDAIGLARALSEVVGGRVHSHDRFGTAKLMFDGQRGPLAYVDFTTARREFYEYSTALPQVLRSSIKQDLYRRDFTINTMAISLDEDTFGELLDFYGGERDLEEGLVRVLHNLSFIEDPIRILRAVRLEQRLGFKLEEMTEELISDALEWLDRVGGERVRQELEAVFDEEEPWKPLRRLSELGVLGQISPLLMWNDWLEASIVGYPAAVEEWAKAHAGHDGGAGPSIPSLAMTYLALVSLGATEENVRDLAQRLKLSNDDTEFLVEVNRLGGGLASLEEPVLSRSAIYHLLWPYSPAAVFVAWLASDEGLPKQRLRVFHSELRPVAPLLDGNELKDMGLPPGPRYAEVLGALRDARLDGEVNTLEDEKRMAQRLVDEATSDGKGDG
jgi:tRNA nucleotidyltransferase (CCA-adding enzyme)